MKKRLSILFGITAVLAAASVGSAFSRTTPVAAEEITTTGVNLYPSVGFEDMLETGVDEYDFTSGMKNSVGRIGGSIKAIRETDNIYLEMGYDGGADAFANTFAFVTLPSEGDYLISFSFRKTAGWIDTDNVGFRLWSSSGYVDGENLATQINSDTSGTWFTLSQVYNVSATSAPHVDSIQLWYNTSSSLVTGLDVDNISIELIVPPTYIPVGDNLYPSVGFDNMLETGVDEYDFASGIKNNVGRIGGSIKAMRETDNVYLKLAYDGGADIFTNTFALLTVSAPGDYEIKFDFRKGANWVDTDNVGFRLWSSTGYVDGDNLSTQINADTSGTWFTITTIYNVSASSFVGVDSLQLWYNTTGSLATSLDVDNISVRATASAADAPEVIGDITKTWREDAAADVTFTLDLHSRPLLSILDEDDAVLTSGTDYTFDEGTGVLTFPSAYVAELGAGNHEFTITTALGSVAVVVNVVYAVGQIPATTDGYDLTPTMLGGTFEDYAVGTSLSMAQTAEAWGSLTSYDDPGVIADDGTGNHVLKLSKASGSDKTYSSAFCMTSPEISLGDIVSLNFRYKLNSDTPAAYSAGATNVTFVGASNTPYHTIPLNGETPAKTAEGDPDSYQWDITYAVVDGYTEVSMSFIVDFAFLNATNSLRFLMPIVNATDSIYIDDVSLVRWVAAGETDEPTVTPATATFDALAPTAIDFTVALKDYNISSIKLDNVNIGSASYTLSSDKTTLTITEAYLATLPNGAHEFTLTTLGGTATFTITVVNVPAVVVPEPGLAWWAWTLISVGGLVVLAGAALLIFKKKK